jgi:hypothetical protein
MGSLVVGVIGTLRSLLGGALQQMQAWRCTLIEMPNDRYSM